MFEIVHVLHLVSGVVWAGGTVFSALVVEPTLLQGSPSEARAWLERASRRAAPLMAISGTVLLVTGLLRAVLGGGVTSLADLLTPYGLLVSAAFAIVIVVTIDGARLRARVAEALAAEGDDTSASLALAAMQRRHAWMTVAGILATLAIMAILGLGLY